MATECPSDSEGPLPVDQQEKNYREYCEYSRSLGREPMDFRPYKGRTNRFGGRPVGVTANVDSETEDCEESESNMVEDYREGY